MTTTDEALKVAANERQKADIAFAVVMESVGLEGLRDAVLDEREGNLECDYTERSFERMIVEQFRDSLPVLVATANAALDARRRHRDASAAFLISISDGGKAGEAFQREERR